MCRNYKKNLQFCPCVLRALTFPFSASTLLVGRQEGHSASKKLDVVLFVGGDDLADDLTILSLQVL